jgi:hypothetical protein
MSRNPKLIGERAECAFLFQALSRGLAVSQPFGDSCAYDAIVDNGKRLLRVQVRSVGYRTAWGLYAVPVWRGRAKRTITPAEIDIVAVWVRPEDVWYIVPARLLGRHRFLWFAPHVENSHARFEQWKERWDLLTKGGEQQRGS